MGTTAAGAAATVLGPSVLAPAQAAPPTGTGTAPVVVTPADGRYDDVVQGVNPRYVGQPEAVYMVDSPDQVADVVRRAVLGDKRLTVRSGGHCLEGFVYNPETQVVLDLSQMSRVYFDAQLGAIAVEPGAVVADMYERLYKTWGVTIPAGIFHSVGAGGHFAGGGHGHLARLHGMAVDHLYAVEVVVVDAERTVRAVVATRDPDDPNRDLWWAHSGGGGGNFGVVTRYLFRSPGALGNDPRKILPQPPAEVLYSTVSLPWSEMTQERFSRLLKNVGAFHEKNKDPTSPYLAVTGGMIMPHCSGGQLTLGTQVHGSPPGAQRLLDRYLAEALDGLGPVQRSTAQRLSWLQSVAFNGGASNHPTIRGDYKSSYMRANFTDRQVEAFYRFLTRPDIENPKIGVSISGYGGRINAVDRNATAFAHRDCSLNLLWSVEWEDPADDVKNITWNREFYGSVHADTGGVPVPDGVTGGCYVNDVDTDIANPTFNRSTSAWHDLYYRDNYAHLRQAKARWDPLNFFRHAMSVQLP
ncbi:FAD-binding oxidoreductase [Pseudonocardia sp. EC080625-04]|nr:FAD-binding protein [Pseudonocardia sp. EC080625-04]ALL85954.1 FAD-linked oxidase [Pseudonocardia sp. EC080619-01]